MLNQKIDVKPPRANSKRFLKKLLQQADNVDELRRLFSAYQAVHAALLRQGYKKFPALDLDLGCPPPHLDAAEFSPEIKKEFEDWVEGDRGD